MGICITEFPIRILGEPYLYHQSDCFARKWEDCGGVKYWDEGANEFDKNLNLISTN